MTTSMVLGDSTLKPLTPSVNAPLEELEWWIEPTSWKGMYYHLQSGHESQPHVQKNISLWHGATTPYSTLMFSYVGTKRNVTWGLIGVAIIWA